MGPQKRGRDPANDFSRYGKHPRLSGQATPNSSQSTVPRSSQASQGYNTTPPSSHTHSSQYPASSQLLGDDEDEVIDLTQEDEGSSQYPASSQLLGDDEDEVIDLTQEDEGSSLDLYGTLDNKIVGVRYYSGVATPHELVSCRREPTNQYDPNAIRVNNVMGAQIGHLPRAVVEKLAPYIDRNEISLEAVLLGEKNTFDCPIRLYLYGTGDPAARLELEDRLKADRLLKATQLKTTRKEAEARRKTTDLKSGTTGAGLGTAAATTHMEEQQASLYSLVAASEALNPQRTDDLTDSLAVGEDELKALPMAEQPSLLKSQLLPYQLQGLAWMIARESPQLPAVNSEDAVQLWKRRGKTQFINLASSFVSSSQPRLISGGVLADDMGLGKTLQIISLVLAQGLKSGPTLIVAPVSVLSNWEQQMRFHVKEDCQPRVLVYHSCKAMSSSELRKYDVVITSYGLISSESKGSKPGRLVGVDWRRVVLDEGHVIRNHKSQTAKAVSSLKAKSRWVLTGTPIINSVKDFLSLLRFLKLTGGLEDEGLFSQVIARPIKQAHSRHPERIRAIRLLGHLMRDICLRRKKDMKFVNLNLPPKTEYIHRVQFDKTEQMKYDAMLADAQGALEKYQQRSKHGQKGRYTNILERLLRLRQICNHWALCKERIDDLLHLFEDQKVVSLNDENIPIFQKALELMVESQEECVICFEQIGLHEPVITACKHVFGKPCISKAIELQGRCPMCRAELQQESLIEPGTEGGDSADFAVDDTCKSSKTEALIKILTATLKTPGSKIVVFSQWTSFLDIIQNRLEEARMTYVRIDGSMAKKARDASISALNENPDARILLASLQVCSVGLNLVAADTVVLADSWWAPAIEDQAVDRVHRLGQTRPTTIWRLVVEGTIEERVLDIQAEKRKLVSDAFREKTKGNKAKDTRSMADISRLLS
ncbi:helicase-like protein [Xylariales sp. AK1849]|nr:helicase-like protein [Xylariales sp. AK1849]